MPDLTGIANKKERDMLRAFLSAVADIKNSTRLGELERAIQAQNYDAVFRILGLDAASFEPLESEIRKAYRTGGLTGIEQIGRIPDPSGIGTIATRFSMASPSALEWLATTSSSFITEILDDQRVMVREQIQAGLERGANPRATALDMIGRVDQVSGKRVGGYVGLTSQQAQWVANARKELEELNPNYLTRTLRDSRLDPAIRKAIESGEPLSSKQINTAITNLQNRTLRYRGETIARTESINALRAGQFESAIQAMDKGEVDPQDAKKKWDSTGDKRTRFDHVELEARYADGIPLEQAFVAIDGSELMYPGDSSMGATAKQIIQCRCRAVIEIDFISKLVRMQGFN